MKIRSDSDALKAFQEIADLFKSGEITEADFENFRSEIETYIKIMQQLSLKKYRQISDCRERVKNILSSTKSKNSEITKLKASINKAMEILQ